MKIDPIEIGLRIVRLRRDKGHRSSASLARQLRVLTGTATPNVETVRQWEKGHRAPPYDMLELLSLELGEPGEMILFGMKAGDLPQERFQLEYVSTDELRLLNVIRHTAKDMHETLIAQADTLRLRHPAKLAEVRKFPPKKS